MNYDMHCEFDIQMHKQTYVDYLEVIITPDGTIHYAVPSHAKYLENIAMAQLNVTHEQLCDMCPREYMFAVVEWLVQITGCISVWTNGVVYHNITDRQYKTLQDLRVAGLYQGPMPEVNQ